MKTSSPPTLVQFRFRLIRLLPFSRLKKIGMERKLNNELLRYELDAARNAQLGKERLDSIRRDHRYEMDMLEEEEELIRSNDVIAQARKLDLPIPFPREDVDEDEDWRTGQYFFTYTLSSAGRARLREAIRKEKKDRHEGRARWLAWLTPVIALGGIVATLLTRK